MPGQNVNAGLKLLHSPERKYLSLTGIGLSIDCESAHCACRKGIPFVIAAVFLMSLQDALFKLVSGDIVLWQG